MEALEVENLIKGGLGDAEVLVDGEGCNFSVVVVSPQFEGCSLLKKQQMVLDTLKDQLASGALHAITVKSYTPDEWQQQSVSK